MACQSIKILYLFSDCCSHVLVQFTNNDTKVYKDNDDSGFAYANIFTVFEREEGTTNERDHYKSLDGKYSIDYGNCGGWGIGNHDSRYEELSRFVLASFHMGHIEMNFG